MRTLGFSLLLLAALISSPAIAGGWGGWDHGGWGHGGWGRGGWSGGWGHGGWGHHGGINLGIGFGFPAFGFYGAPVYYPAPPPPPPVYQQPAVYEPPPPSPVYQQPSVAPSPTVHPTHRHRVVQHRSHCSCRWVDPKPVPDKVEAGKLRAGLN